MVAGSLKEEHNITIDGEKVKQVESFKYLGSTKTTTAACSGDIKSRIAIAKRNDRNLSKDLKVRLVRALVWSSLIYGAEAWTLFKSDENRIMAAEMWIWRRMLGVSWKEKTTNASILSELDVQNELLGKIMTLKLAYFGHIMRGSGSPLTLQIVEGMVEGKRKRGEQKKQWFDNIREWTGLSYMRAKRSAQQWRIQDGIPPGCKPRTGFWRPWAN